VKDEHELIYNLDLARKNATRCAGYLERVQEAHEGDIADLIAIAMDLETQIEELISELGEETDD
jgi:hypothetical protein